jgi:hypothetical protein
MTISSLLAGTRLLLNRLIALAIRRVAQPAERYEQGFAKATGFQ